MAHREALKELQTRLAARLQAAKAENITVASWLAVESGERRFLLPLAQAGEISAWAGVQPVPYTQPWFLGVANLRGTLTGVVDLAGQASVPSAALGHAGALGGFPDQPEAERPVEHHDGPQAAAARHGQRRGPHGLAARRDLRGMRREGLGRDLRHGRDEGGNPWEHRQSAQRWPRTFWRA